MGGAYTLILVFLYFLIHSHYKKKLVYKDEQISLMQVTLNEMQSKVKELERRRGFRVNLPDTECYFTLVDSNDKNLEPLKNKKGKGWVRDISWIGIKMACPYDLPVRKEIILQIQFTIKNEEFTVMGKIVRKEELIHEYNYGIELKHRNVNEQQRLYLLLQKMVLEQEKK